MRLSERQHGMTLLEVLVAAVIMGMIGLGVASLFKAHIDHLREANAREEAVATFDELIAVLKRSVTRRAHFDDPSIAAQAPAALVNPPFVSLARCTMGSISLTLQDGTTKQVPRRDCRELKAATLTPTDSVVPVDVATVCTQAAPAIQGLNLSSLGSPCRVACPAGQVPHVVVQGLAASPQLFPAGSAASSTKIAALAACLSTTDLPLGPASQVQIALQAAILVRGKPIVVAKTFAIALDALSPAGVASLPNN